MNPQQLLPLVQLLALPLYGLIGHHGLGLSGACLVGFTVAAPFATHVAVLTGGFLVAYRCQHETRGIRHSRLRDWLIAWPGEIATSLRAYYWLLPFRSGFAPNAPKRAASARLPILFLHGYGCNRGLWLPAARWFAARGYPLAAINLVPANADIDHHAIAIADAIRSLCASSGQERVALICHSMGGLAARAFFRHCRHHGVDPAVAAVITLGTPHRGTHLAGFGIGACAHQMRFDSDWLIELTRDEAQWARDEAGNCGQFLAPARPPLTTVSSLQDNIVSRQTMQGLAGARNIVIRRQGHMALVLSLRVFRVIDRILAARSPERRQRRNPSGLLKRTSGLARCSRSS